MAITINGSGTITGISTGGLPDGIVDDGTLATSAVTSIKIADGAIINADVSSSAALATSKITGLATSATTDTTDASNITTGTINNDRLSSVPASKLTGLKTVGGASVVGTGDITVDTVNKASSNPLITTNGSLGDQWINTTTGELFILKDATTNSNVWKGQNGSDITPSTASTFDIFSDSSSLALYQFDGNANDTGGSYNGSSTNVTYSTGKLGNASSYNGSSSYTTLGGITMSYPFSVSVWIKPVSLSPGGADLVVNLALGSQRVSLCIAEVYGVSNTVGIMFGGTSHFSGGTNAISTGSWQHIVWSVTSSNNSVIYLDGSVVTQTNHGGSHGGSAGNTFGANGSNNGEFYDGLLDQVRIFNKTLSSSEVATLYAET